MDGYDGDTTRPLFSPTRPFGSGVKSNRSPPSVCSLLLCFFIGSIKVSRRSLLFRYFVVYLPPQPRRHANRHFLHPSSVAVSDIGVRSTNDLQKVSGP